jgi:hypothetical protein
MTVKGKTAEPQRAPRPFKLKVASWLRWVHTYLSMFALMLILFFSATGITLNHPDWFTSAKPRETQSTGKVSPEWLATGDTDSAKVAKLEIVEALRKAGARGALEEFRIDDQECMVSFKAPGYSADSFVNRETGTYQMTVIEEGAIAYMNDLHKGRHAGTVWARMVDFSALFLVIISLTGLGLIFFLKRIRAAALLTALGGLVAMVLIIKLLVP